MEFPLSRGGHFQLQTSTFTFFVPNGLNNEEAGANEKTLKDNVNSSIKFYFGETSRDAYTRGAEHLSDYIGQTDDSHMYKHLSDSHQDSRPRDVKFGMSVIKQHRSSFERMIFESCLIFRNENNVLNSKTEFNRCQPGSKIVSDD